jgi:hypothetical protein
VIDPDILKHFGSTNDALKKLFTAQPADALHAKRKAWEKRIEGRIQEGLTFNMRNYRLWAVSDLAWDSQPITKEVVPLMQYVQGRIDFKALSTQLKDVPQETLAKFCEFDDKTKAIKSVNVGKFHEVWINLVRSFITRRVATLAVGRLRQYPFLKYEPMSTSYVAKLRGDVLSQRAEVMTNQYGYRRDLVQSLRAMFLYSHSVEVVAGAWDVQRQLFKKPAVEGQPEGEIHTHGGAHRP